jgi:hypothetical protein
MPHVMYPADETLVVKLAYEELIRISLGFSQRGRMTGSYALIGLPDRPVSATNPGKYYILQVKPSTRSGSCQTHSKLLPIQA